MQLPTKHKEPLAQRSLPKIPQSMKQTKYKELTLQVYTYPYIIYPPCKFRLFFLLRLLYRLSLHNRKSVIYYSKERKKRKKPPAGFGRVIRCYRKIQEWRPHSILFQIQ